ncbi:hypothetical protein HaLaN_10900 [Haematococcus lacustris]|uniref:Uncharacterized protein n=1 Tax=Haematococcus lacustris TaxID=44745 RepID=A0A699Z660_HAELA|nr:hypothetical protein HaLaN_10900 [Haematococcus lacustris]
MGPPPARTKQVGGRALYLTTTDVRYHLSFITQLEPGRPSSLTLGLLSQLEGVSVEEDYPQAIPLAGHLTLTFDTPFPRC